MLEKIFSGLALIPLVVGILILAFNTQLVTADWTWTETIYIRADGSVYPDTASISSVDSITYTLTDNIVSSAASAIIGYRDNIVLDGAGYTLQGPGSGTGIQFGGRNNVTVRNMKIRDFRQGLSLSSCSNSIICENTITDVGQRGILLHESLNNRIYGNNITSQGSGIWLREYSKFNQVYQNNITSCLGGGVSISLWAEWNNIYENNLVSNRYGIELGDNPAFNNIIYRNNFIGNTNRQVYIRTSCTNFWDDSYPSGGNYWDDYTGVDEYRGPNQDMLGSDGIGDTPYVIDTDNTDHFPIVHPFGSPYEGLWSLTRQIETMNLQQGIEKSLATQLRNVIESLDKNLESLAATQLRAFVHYVEALNGKKLTDEQANYLIVEAQRIIGFIEE